MPCLKTSSLVSERNSATSPIGNKVQLKCNLPSNTLTIDKTKQKPKPKKKKLPNNQKADTQPLWSRVGWKFDEVQVQSPYKKGRQQVHPPPHGSHCPRH